MEPGSGGRQPAAQGRTGPGDEQRAARQGKLLRFNFQPGEMTGGQQTGGHRKAQVRGLVFCQKQGDAGRGNTLCNHFVSDMLRKNNFLERFRPFNPMIINFFRFFHAKYMEIEKELCYTLVAAIM